MIIYMNITGIRGTGGGSRAGWIWAEKCTFGFERGAETESEDDEGATEIKKPDVQAVVIEKPADSASVALARWLEKGDARTVKVEFCVSSKVPVMRCTLEKAHLRTYRSTMNATAKDAQVVETLSIDYVSIEVEYKQYGVDNLASTAQTQFEYDAEAS